MLWSVVGMGQSQYGVKPGTILIEGRIGEVALVPTYAAALCINELVHLKPCVRDVAQQASSAFMEVHLATASVIFGNRQIRQSRLDSPVDHLDVRQQWHSSVRLDVV